MECLDTIKSLKINFKKNVGTILLIVEGAKTEIELFKRIFRDVLGYKVIAKSRNMSEFKTYDEFVRPDNANSRFIIINAKNSNIATIEKDKDYLNELYINLYNEYGIDIKNMRVYFIWDRDNRSNDADEVRKHIKRLTNSLDNDLGDMHGLLLLSYPNLEAYIASNFNKQYSLKNTKDLKAFLKEKNILVRDITKDSIRLAAIQMHKTLKSFNIREYNLNRMSKEMLKVFEKEEEYYLKYGYYKWISFISIILIEVGILEEK